MERRGRLSEEVKEQAVRLVFRQAPSHPSQQAATESIAKRMGCAAEKLRSWVRQAERDAGKRAGLTTSEREGPKERRDAAN